VRGVGARGASTLPSGGSSSGGDPDMARDFVVQRGIHPEVAKAVIKELSSPDWGVPPGGLLAMVTRMAGRYEVGEDAGLNSLAQACEREMSASLGKQLVRFWVTPNNGEGAFECQGFEGMSLRDVIGHEGDESAKLLSEYLECACSGVMACSTCHVYVEPEWRQAVGPPTEEEEDMLDLAYERRDESRLGCQIVLSPQLNGLRLSLPRGANNLFDHIPFE